MEAIFENVCVRNREVTKEIYNYYFSGAIGQLLRILFWVLCLLPI